MDMGMEGKCWGAYLGPFALFLERDGLGGEEEVEDAVCEADVAIIRSR